ncbi:hypothetical protein LOK74_07725 [Brevibacillus humidisoli]|uniref:hypothetical protein n=1 Tax=Brevibacillus humidisoli TaxID=2895522 RepID=UPI001E35B77E|nr:hypothetical protein [Brevibacillus humidisoli]UFJ42365.1 hypothetical protein LOK74_07725 [Brevibacillus humidisoli]
MAESVQETTSESKLVNPKNQLFERAKKGITDLQNDGTISATLRASKDKVSEAGTISTTQLLRVTETKGNKTEGYATTVFASVPFSELDEEGSDLPVGNL